MKFGWDIYRGLKYTYKELYFLVNKIRKKNISDNLNQLRIQGAKIDDNEEKLQHQKIDMYMGLL